MDCLAGSAKLLRAMNEGAALGHHTIHHVDVPGLGRPGLVGALQRALRTLVGVDNDVNLPLGPPSSPDLRPDLHDVVGGRAVLALAKEHGIEAAAPGEAVLQASPAMLAALAERIAVVI